MLTTTTSPYGLVHADFVDYQGHLLERETAKALGQMALAASRGGIKIEVCSGYRDFSRQLKIWNDKAQGKRTVLDQDSQPVELKHKSDKEILELIMLWSALPGTSRHHWGTDIDVYDANSIQLNQLQLVSSEYLSSGPCGNLHQWLIKHAGDFGFYFPFQEGLSGVSAEPWHLSYYPVSSDILRVFDVDVLKQILNEADLELKTEVMARIDSLVEEYVYTIAPPPNQL
ncbi:M15 family metallopeptidase [Shewanella atlantica]|uniref:D-alanyl-D-alanine carboxypeptidase family protein n=1 Tax=Shewanella atlantica TaxID=271099 RepID=A0A3S0KLP3_9GAMM|nr:M15 family metallopeptidase [Shewanella atlantica]RTR33326.1 D-alanyl-D-alanine carboxypeptidase family protein [Shewanella atlantica]